MGSKARFFFSVPVLIVLAVLACAIAFIKSDFAAERVCKLLRHSLDDRLGLSVGIDSCNIDLLPPTLAVNKLSLLDTSGGPLLESERVQIELDSLSLLAGDFQVDRATLSKPQVHLKIVDGQLMNLPLLAGSGEGSAAGGNKFAGLPERVDLEGGRLDVIVDRWGLVQLRDLGLDLVKGEDDTLQIAAVVGGGQVDLASGEGTSLVLKPCRCKLVLGSQHADLAHCNLDLDQLSLKGSGRVVFGPDGPEPNLNLTLSGPLSLLSRFEPELPAFDGQLVGSADVVRTEKGWTARGAMDVKGFGVETVHSVDLKTLFSVDRSGLELVNLQLDSPATQFGGKLYLAFSPDLAFNGTLAVDRVDLFECLKMGGIHHWRYMDVTGSADVKLNGQFAGKGAPHVAMKAKVKADRLWVRADPAGQPVITMDGADVWTDGAFNGRRMRFFNSRVVKGQTVLGGECRWRFSDWDMRGKTSSTKLDLADISPVAGLDFAGQGGFELDIGGTVFEPRMSALVHARDVAMEGRPVGFLRGRVSLDDTVLGFEPMVLSRYGGTVRLDGNLELSSPFKVGATADLVRIKLPELVAALTMGRRSDYLTGGLVGGQITASGNLDSPVLDFRVAFADLLVGEQRLPEGGLVGRLEDGAWRLDLFEASMGPGWLFARGEISKDLELDLVAYSTGLKAESFQQLAGVRDLMDFRLDLHVGVRGPLRSPALDGWVKVYDTVLAGRQLDDTSLSAKATAESFQVAGSILGDVARMELKAELAADLPFSGQVTFASDKLSQFLVDPDTEVKPLALLAGKLQASGRLLSPEQILAQLTLGEARIEYGQVSLANEGPIEVRLAAGALTLDRCFLKGPKTSLQVSGGGQIDSGPRLKAEGSADLELLPVLLPVIRRARGSANILIGLGGTWTAPSMEGSLAFSASNLRFSSIPDDLQHVTGRLIFTPSKLEVTKVRGQLGGGDFTVWGDLRLQDLALQRMALTIELDKVRYQASRQLWGVGTGTLNLSQAPGQRMNLSGQLHIGEGGYQEHISLVSFSDGMFRRRRPKARTFDKRNEVLDFDVRLLAPGNFQALYNLDLVKFQAEMKGDLRLTGTNERMGVLGELDARKGTVSYLSKEFSIDTARVIFASRYNVNPRIEIQASRPETVDRGEEGKINYQVILGLAGEGDDIKVTLNSNPTLDERDIVTLLSLGITSQDMDQLQGDDLVGLGGEIFLRSLKLDERLTKLFPFPPEVIQPKYLRMRSRFSNQIEKTTPRLETGVKLRLISEDLDLDYSRSLYYDEDQSLELSYRLTSGVSARLRWEDSTDNEYGDLGLDLKLNWEW